MGVNLQANIPSLFLWQKRCGSLSKLVPKTGLEQEVPIAYPMDCALPIDSDLLCRARWRFSSPSCHMGVLCARGCRCALQWGKGVHQGKQADRVLDKHCAQSPGCAQRSCSEGERCFPAEKANMGKLKSFASMCRVSSWGLSTEG